MEMTLWFTCIQFSALMMVAARGQPTIQEDMWGQLRSKECVSKALQDTFKRLIYEVKGQVNESKDIRRELGAVLNHNRQSRDVLARLTETLHTFVTKMAVKYPCDCAAASVSVNKTNEDAGV